jgi:predicted DCC family thiol-disulfide oxidoreductase YuxK
MKAANTFLDRISESLPAGSIVLFDAKCVLCSANAQFILTHDKAGRFHLASMQGRSGQHFSVSTGWIRPIRRVFW